MTDDRNKNDVDDFFKKFEEIDNKKKKAEISDKSMSDIIPEETAPFTFEELEERKKPEPKISEKDNIVANRSGRLAKEKNEKAVMEKRTPDKKEKKNKNRREEEITDLEDIFGYSERDVKEKRAKRKKKQQKKKKRAKWVRRILALCGVTMVIGIVMVAFILQDTQNIKWDNIYDYLSEASTIYDSDKKKIESIHSSSGNRIIVGYDEMPEDLVNAFVSIEDKTFWDHHGFNFTRMGGAVLEFVKGGGKVGGTSTITQQLARNLWLAETKSERSITRKIKEAYYAIQLERHLSKEEIVEAYLNTIALGQNCLGVQSASQTYFSKDVKDLTVLESAAIASLAQAPGRYSYIKPVASDEVSKNDSKIVKRGEVNTYLYNDTAEKRVQTVLDLMEEQNYITKKEHDKAKVSKLKSKIKPNVSEQTNEAQFFIDYTIKALIKDLMSEFNRTEQEATQMVYSGGLKIYTTLDRKLQNSAEKEFQDSSNFPNVTNLSKDSSGNVLNDSGSVLLYKYSNYFDSDGNFTLKKGEFKKQDDGTILLKKGKRLSFYETKSSAGPDINIEFKNMYLESNGTFYSINGGVINIPAKYKKLDSKGNLIVDMKFMEEKDYTDYMDVKKSEIEISRSGYTLRQQVQQPQASMVIIDHSNGQIKAMVGGRNIQGKMNFNRATSTRQPGSAIKPIAVYAPALEMGANHEKIKEGESSYGDYWTAASKIRDEEMKYEGKVWPKNWYPGYRGTMPLRKAVEQSVNTISVKVLNNIGIDKSVDFLENLGVTSIVHDGKSNDLKPAALALGGMTNGISPIEMASAYGTFPNKGLYVEPKPYSEIRTKDDSLVLKNEPESKKVMDPGTAFIMNDILRTTVTNGIAQNASISGQPVAGKTGTTTDNFDAWFVGSTPKYSAALWIGNDISIQLSKGSAAASQLWSKIISNGTEGDEEGEFSDPPQNVEKKGNEYFIDGTAP